MRQLMLCGLVILLLAAANLHAQPVDVSGTIEQPSPEQANAEAVLLKENTTFGWKLGVFKPAVQLNGHTLRVDTGGGNRLEISGAITGNGNLIWNGGGSEQLQTAPSFLSGDKPNTFTGTLTIERGTLALKKPAGVPAFSGKQLVLGGGVNQAIVRLDAADQLPDDCQVLITGDHEGRIWTQGHHETLGSLDLQAHGSIHLGDGASTLTFADSSKLKWKADKTLTIDGWTQGKDRVIFKGGKSSLSPVQLARIGFADPQGKPAGLYAATITEQGELLPGASVDAVNPPFEVTAAAMKKREALYKVAGVDKLTAADTPLRDGMHISFFGDSITWQNQYIRRIEQAIRKSEHTKKLTIHLHNHGVNGGGVLAIRDGSDNAAYVDEKNQNGPQLAFEKVIAADKADVAIIMIGINDVWWRNTSPADFEKALRDITKSAKARGTIPVLATVTTIGELPDGGNEKDKALDQFAEITRKVARESGITLLDTRAAFIAYLQNHNAKLRVDGSLVMRKAGFLTYDGVHPSDRGNDLLADLMADAIVRALAR